jgi:hypothetical protein
LWPAVVLAQNDVVVELPAAREVGEKHRIELIKEREGYEGENLKVSVKSRTFINVEVVAGLEQGVVIRWTYGPSRVETAAADEVAREWAGKMANLSENLRLDMRTDAFGSIESLQNIDEVVSRARETYKALLGWIGEKGLPKEFIGELESALGPSMDPETVEAMILAEARLLYFPSGGTYRLGMMQEYEDLLPNPLGGPPFPSRAYFRLEAVEPQDDLARIAWRQVIDPEKAGPILRRTIEAMFERMGRPVPPDLPVLEIEIEDRADYAYDTKTGWPRGLSHTRTIAVGANRTVQRLEFRVLAGEGR